MNRERQMWCARALDVWRGDNDFNRVKFQVDNFSNEAFFFSFFCLFVYLNVIICVFLFVCERVRERERM
jgi:hypothetical protein